MSKSWRNISSPDRSNKLRSQVHSTDVTFMESNSDVSLLVSGTETSEKAEVAQQ
jgi:hypothetical protein